MLQHRSARKKRGLFILELFLPAEPTKGALGAVDGFMAIL